MGDQEAVKDAIHSLAAILGTSDNKDLWDKFRCAFYRLASDLLGDTAIPEDLGALRLIFQDCVPSLGPQPYFPQVRTAMNAESSMETMSVEELANHVKGISGNFLFHNTLRLDYTIHYTRHYTGTGVPMQTLSFLMPFKLMILKIINFNYGHV